MRITLTRWHNAQKFELQEWLSSKDVVKKEWKEATNKYSSYLSKVESSLGLRETSKILDVGCNVTCVSRLLKKGIHYGIDPLASKLKTQSRVTGVKIYEGLAEDMSMFSDNMFDFILCRNVIDHTFSPVQVIQEISRVIKPNGHLLLAGYIYNPFISFVKNLGELLFVFKNVGHPHTYTENTFEQLVTQKFNIVEKKIIYEGISPNDFGKVDEMKGNLSSVERIVMFINDKILYRKWFVREYSLLCVSKNP